ncbi:MAG TPA: virulence RhuM family protein [Candidatus Bacteroides merdipullorum]|uniref:Virulence RhuM family protein n=1 Tax=Candidatus Bacteroides merdipullorum TaxID=2838474 RepID=A0A9D2CY07_9BACE|nr:virulence RhuM family protein [Candidatus Bacteroides merdipullorum]
MENQGEIILYQPDNEVKLEVRLENETVWLNRQQLSELFARDIKTIGKHVNNALKEELAGISVVAKFATTAADGKVYQVEYYNLDMVLSVGYRVKSNRGIEFRRWANKVLKEYLLKGHAINYRLGIHTYKKCHDRFLIIDGTDIYHIGASLKDLGKKMFAFSKLEIPAAAITALL